MQHLKLADRTIAYTFAAVVVLLIVTAVTAVKSAVAFMVWNYLLHAIVDVPTLTFWHFAVIILLSDVIHRQIDKFLRFE